MIDIATRTRLEVEFCRKLNYVIDQLIRENLLEEEINTFTETIKYFLKYQDIKEYIVSTLYEKTSEIAKVFIIVDRKLSASLKKFIMILVTLDDKEVLEMLENNFAKEKNLDNFFLLIEQERLQNKDTSNCEKLFLSLMTLQDMSLGRINSFLLALNQDKDYLVSKLIASKSFVALRKYTEKIVNNEVYTIKEIVPVLTREYDDKISSNYLELVRIISTKNPSFLEEMLYVGKWDIRCLFEDYILNSSTGNMQLINNYCEYLMNKGGSLFFDFEKLYLNTARSADIVKFARTVSFSSKREILRKLVENKEEDSLVEFIKNFEEYKHLLPML